MRNIIIDKPNRIIDTDRVQAEQIARMRTRREYEKQLLKPIIEVW